MKNLINVIVSIFTFLIGGFDNLFITLLLFMLIDYITGIIKGIINKELSSNKGLYGILKKVGIIFIVVIASLVDTIVDTSNAVRTLTIYFFIPNEGISILENSSSIGLPMPKRLLDIFNKIKEK